MTTIRASFLGYDGGPDPDYDPIPDEVREKFKESTVKRAAKRVKDVSETLVGWAVAQRSDLGDICPHVVNFQSDTGKYHCSCYDTNHGGSRARKVCTHVLAVIIWRKQRAQENGKHRAREDAAGVDAPAAQEPTEEGLRHSPPPTSLHEIGPARWPPLPDWLTAYYDHQWKAAHEIVAYFNAGKKVVMVDAPTGTGKTALADLVGRLLESEITYVCTDRGLQDQVLREFPYARVLKGRANYLTMQGGTLGSPTTPTADDCDGNIRDDDCSYCDPMKQCPYRVAKAAALDSELAVLNTAYFMREANHGKKGGEFSDTSRLLVIDECDTLEDMLMGYVEFTVGKTTARRLKVEPPKKGSHYATIVKWIEGPLIEAMTQHRDTLGNATLEARRERRRMNEAINRARDVARAIVEGEWVRQSIPDSLVMKPVAVSEYGQDVIFKHADRVLMMSASIISAEGMAEDVGIAEDEWALVRVPMTFPPELRQINVAPVADNIYREKEEAWPKIAHAIRVVCEDHCDERVLVHTVSYDFTRYLMKELRGPLKIQGRNAFTYLNPRDREQALTDFKNTPGAVIFAPSFGRGVDLKGDLCRVVIVAKVPFPSIGDAQVKARMHSKGGEAWYARQTIRALVQMTGRAVRSMDDFSTTYILDRQFSQNIYRKWKRLFPQWWRDAVNKSYSTKHLKMPDDAS